MHLPLSDPFSLSFSLSRARSFCVFISLTRVLMLPLSVMKTLTLSLFPSSHLSLFAKLLSLCVYHIIIRSLSFCHTVGLHLLFLFSLSLCLSPYPFHSTLYEHMHTHTHTYAHNCTHTVAHILAQAPAHGGNGIILHERHVNWHSTTHYNTLQLIATHCKTNTVATAVFAMRDNQKNTLCTTDPRQTCGQTPIAHGQDQNDLLKNKLAGMYVRVYIHTHTYTHTHTHTHIKVYTCIYVNACVHTHTHTHTRARVRTHTTTSTHAHTRSLSHVRMLSCTQSTSHFLVCALSPSLALCLCLSLRVSFCSWASPPHSVTLQKYVYADGLCHLFIAKLFSPSLSLSLSLFLSCSFCLYMYWLILL